MKDHLFFTSTSLSFSPVVVLTLVIQLCAAPKPDIPMDKVFDVKWVHAHEDGHEDVEAYRPDTYQFPPSRGRRGFKMLRDKTFINYEIAPTDGIVERKGRWEKENDHTFAVLFGENGSHRNFRLEFVSYKKNLLKLKIIQN